MPSLQAALDELLESGRHDVSLVDRVSFARMRQRGVRTAVSLDSDFRGEGFKLMLGQEQG